MSFIDELRRRNVHRVAIGYLASAWLIIQILETLFPIFGGSETSVRWVVIALAIGFVPAVILSWVFELTPAGIRRDADVPRTDQPRSSKVLDRVLILVLTAALGYFAVDKFILDAGVQTQVEQMPAEASSNVGGEHSIAVLPFVNMSADPDQEYFSDGISEELSNLLAQVPELRVISRTSAFSFKGQQIEIPEVAARLNVGHVLEGSVRRSGNRVRITAQLIDARTDTHLWSESFDRDLDDVFAVQDEISAKVVAQLKVTILGKAPTSERINSEAYGLYLRARYINHGGRYDKLPLAAELLNRALELEPDYVPALSELARVYLNLDADTLKPLGNRRELIRGLVARIAAVSPDSSEALGWRSWIAHYWEGDVPEAARLLERALAVDPRNLDTLRPASALLLDLGYTDDALAVAKYVAVRDPACSVCLGNLSWVYRAAGRFEDAERVLRDAMAWAPDRYEIHWALGSVLLMAGKPAEALVVFDQDALEREGQFGRIMALHDLGRTAEFEEAFAAFRSNEPDNYEGIARIYAWTGDNDKALEWLEKYAAQEGPNTLVSLGVGFYEKLKRDPRFDVLMRKHGVDPDRYKGISLHFTLPEQLN